MDTVAYFTTPDGNEMAVLPRADYEDLRDAATRAAEVAAYKAGNLPGLTPKQALMLVDAETPLLFWRKHAGLTQTALSSRSGISQSYLAELESGVRAGSLKVWIKLSKALDVPIEALVGDSE